MSWLEWQLDYLYLLQNFREISGHVFDKFFLNITMFGEIAIPIMFITFIYWCINKRAGIYILWNYMFGFVVNLFLKTTACIYRPWLLDSRIQPLAESIPGATGYSFPSGHTAGAMSTWGGLAVYFWNNKLIRYSCMCLILLIMFSRNYVGVHTPQDVLVSCFVGVLLLFSSKKLLDWENRTKNADLIICGVITLVCLLLTLYVNFKPYPLSCFGCSEYFDPTHIKVSTFGIVGCVIGAFYGWLIEKRFVNFETTGGFWLKLIRYIIGILVLVFINTNLVPLLCRILPEISGLFVSNFIIGLYITLIYPFIIKKYLQKKI